MEYPVLAKIAIAESMMAASSSTTKILYIDFYYPMLAVLVQVAV